MNNLSVNFDNAWYAYTDLRSFLTTLHVEENKYGEESYQAGYAAGLIIYNLFVTREFDREEPLDPFTTLSNYGKE